MQQNQFRQKIQFHYNTAWYNAIVHTAVREMININYRPDFELKTDNLYFTSEMSNACIFWALQR